MYQRILVPLDGSEIAERALAHAERVVAPGGTITLVEVVRPPLAVPPAEGVSVRDPEQFARQFRETRERPRADAEAYLTDARRKLTRTDVTVRTLVLEGHPVDRISEAARDADLVAISTQGRTGLARFLMGSVAERVVRHAPVPVLVVR